VFEDVTGGADMLSVGRFEMPSRAYLGRFNFKGSDQQKIVGNLSGGERGRLHLAKTLLKGGNVLLLDEPSNDLDVETLRALEDALLEFAGSVMVISHDRWFLDRIATHILAFEGNSQVTFFDGNYQEYEADKKKRLGEEGREAPKRRIRYKPLTWFCDGGWHGDLQSIFNNFDFRIRVVCGVFSAEMKYLLSQIKRKTENFANHIRNFR
jgi:sulfate-transporting ATPase